MEAKVSAVPDSLYECLVGHKYLYIYIYVVIWKYFSELFPVI